MPDPTQEPRPAGEEQPASISAGEPQRLDRQRGVVADQEPDQLELDRRQAAIRSTRRPGGPPLGPGDAPSRNAIAGDTADVPDVDPIDLSE
jgi:hypothetical protein